VKFRGGRPPAKIGATSNRWRAVAPLYRYIDDGKVIVMHGDLTAADDVLSSTKTGGGALIG